MLGTSDTPFKHLFIMAYMSIGELASGFKQYPDAKKSKSHYQ
jgi:hypothetical protein